MTAKQKVWIKFISQETRYHRRRLTYHCQENVINTNETVNSYIQLAPPKSGNKK
jgi:hypothetical protein